MDIQVNGPVAVNDTDAMLAMALKGMCLTAGHSTGVPHRHWQ